MKALYSDDYIYSVSYSAAAQRYQRELAGRWAEDHGLKGLRVLDVGGGDGFFASLLESFGCHVTLIDPSQRACGIARDRGISSVIQGFFPEDLQPGPLFDAIVMRHVLEHVPSPTAVLRAATQHLRAEGKLFVEVPNLDAIVKKRRFQDFYREHVSYFAPATLTAVCAKVGFRVLEAYLIENDDYLAVVCENHVPAFDLMADAVTEFRGRARAFLEEAIASGRRLALWGAGARGVSLMALLGVRDLGVAYVVDSDARKWRSLTPVTCLPVVPPELLISDPVDDVVIVALSFQDEILQWLRTHLGPGQRVGILEPEPRWLSQSQNRRTKRMGRLVMALPETDAPRHKERLACDNPGFGVRR